MVVCHAYSYHQYIRVLETCLPPLLLNFEIVPLAENNMALTFSASGWEKKRKALLVANFMHTKDYWCDYKLAMIVVVEVMTDTIKIID